MTDEIKTSGIKLVLTPASVLEAVVKAKLPMSTLVDLARLENIINAEDLLFYKWVQSKVKSVLPRPISQYFEKGLVDDDYQESEQSKLSELRFKQMTSTSMDLNRLLAISEKTANQPIAISSSNTYVGHYYAIDKQTIGCVLMVSDNVVSDEILALKGLLTLLANQYLGSVDGHLNTTNDVHIVNLVKSGLVSAYASYNSKTGNEYVRTTTS